MSTSNLAKFCSTIKYDELSKKVTDKVKELLLDHLGCALYGTLLVSSKIVRNLILDQGGIPESTILGSQKKVPSLNAAFVNGVSAHGPELDDTEATTALHPGTCIIPAALAICEKNRLNGRILIASIVGGYEAAIRIASAVQGKDMSHYKRGFHPTATCGTFGSTVSSCRALGLSTNEMENALGLAGSQAAGLLEFLTDGSLVKRFGAGRASHNGVLSALLAQNGFTGPKTVLEGRYGFIRAYSDKPDLSALTDGLGERYRILDVGIKPHSCCRYAQAPIDVTLAAMRKFSIKPEQIERVEVRVVDTAMKLCYGEPLEARYRPRNIVDAQFSLPYGIASAIIHGRAFIDEYTEEAIKDSAVLKMAKKVTVKHKAELDRSYPRLWPAEVTITRKNRAVVKYSVKTSKGDPVNPLNKAELNNKFKTLAGRVLKEKSLNDLIEKIENLENLSDVTELISFLDYKAS